MSKINVLSLFDGISCARIALDRLNVDCNYFASEIDKFAIQVSKSNYKDITHLGDVKNIVSSTLPKIDLLIGGSPCVDLSVANLSSRRLGLEGTKSGLFYEYLRLLDELKPTYFLLENVASMKNDQRDMISKYLNVPHILINSLDFSAQKRKRYYWTNIKVDDFTPKNILLKDILETNVDSKYYFDDEKLAKVVYAKGKKEVKRNYDGFEFVYKEGAIPFPNDPNKKANCLISSQSNRTINVVKDDKGYRKLTPLECERLQTVSDNYTSVVSDSQRYKQLGNGFTIDVIAHLIKNIK